VLFRADSFEQGLFFVSQMFTGFHFEYASTALAMEQLTPLFIVVFLVALVACTPLKQLVERRLLQSALLVQKLATAASYVFAFVLLFVCILSLSGGGYNPFIYFRF